MSIKSGSIVFFLLLLAVAGGWYLSERSKATADHRVAEALLQPMQRLTAETQSLLTDLSTPEYREGDAGILESYLIKVRRDGMPKNAEMRRHLNALAEDNSELLALINAYAPLSKTAAFAAASRRFIAYSISWRDRWDAGMELFMAGGNYPTAVVVFPTDLPAALKEEVSSISQ